MEDSLAKVVREMNETLTKDSIYRAFIERLRDNFHVILCMSPVGDALR